MIAVKITPDVKRKIEAHGVFRSMEYLHKSMKGAGVWLDIRSLRSIVDKIHSGDYKALEWTPTNNYPNGTIVVEL